MYIYPDSGRCGPCLLQKCRCNIHPRLDQTRTPGLNIEGTEANSAAYLGGTLHGSSRDHDFSPIAMNLRAASRNDKQTSPL